MKMVLKRQLPSLGPVNRPSGTEFRPGDEVFLCPKGRPLAQGKQFIIYGFFQENKKHPTYTTVMLIDEDVWGEYQKDPNPENGLLENLFRACPVKFVGHTPNGRHVDSTGSLLDATFETFQRFLSIHALSKKGLHEFDILRAHPKIEDKTKQNIITLIQTR